MMSTEHRARTAFSILRSVLFGFLLLSINACGSGGSGGGATPSPSVGVVTLSGTVSGTVIKVLNANTNGMLAQTDTAALPGPSPFPFSLFNLPAGVPLKVFFFSGGETFPLFVGNPSTNVFTVTSAGTIDLGDVTMSGGTATPSNEPPSGSIVLGNSDPSIPPAILPLPATLTVPASVPGTGSADINFAVQNFSIGGQGQQHVHINVGGGPTRHFFNGSSNTVVDENGNPTSDVQWLSSDSFRLNGLSVGPHQVTVKLATAAETLFVNSEANPLPITVTINNNPRVNSITVTSGSSFLSSPVKIVFSVTNFTIGLPGNPHLRFSLDGGVLHDFYNGAGITSDNGVLLNGVHNHAVHWTSATSFDLFGLAAGGHQVRLVLVDGSNAELPGTSVTHGFTVQQPPTGELQLEPVLGGLNLPSALQQAPDGRIFINERETGQILVVNQIGSTWQLNPTPFCTVQVVVNGDQGLLGLALDPAFSSSNEVVYVFYTSASGNRVSRLTRSSGNCVETTILGGLPTTAIHNGGIIQFGPDGKLYVVTGDAENPANAQNVTSLAGKVLRVNPDGSTPTDNPFFGNTNANARKVFSLGHRNSFGLTFHPQTGDLWETENGQDDFDEVNRVISGGNYGWDNSLRSGFLNRPCCVNPIVALPIIAPTGIVAVPANSMIYPQAYRNSLLVAAWNDGSIRLVVPNASNPNGPGTTSVAYPGGEGGLVGMMLGNDGYVYVSNHDFNVVNGSSIFRVIPH